VLRRRALAILCGAFSPAGFAGARRLDGYLDSPHGAAVLVDIGGRRLIAAGGAAGRSLQPPGSTLKPLVIAALIESGQLRRETFFCPRRLRIRGRSFDCIHPELAEPVTPKLALAYSCNCYVAHAAERFEPGELARELERFGLASPSGLFKDETAGRVRPAATLDDQRIQALGEADVEVTPAGLAMAYRLLAMRIANPAIEPVRKGLEGAIEFGTAQNARIPGAEIAGKTGSAMNAQGEPVAWFAGWVPASAPKAALAVMLAARSGGADAAPVARKIFDSYLKGEL
jgi:penicillin-binding protein A